MIERRADRAVDPFFSLARYSDFVDVVGAENQRFLLAPLDPAQVTLQEILQQHQVPVLRQEVGGNRMAYVVPDGTQLLDNLRIAMRRNVHAYSGVFQQVGRISSRLATAGFEISTAISTIAQKTALSFDTSRGGQSEVVLVPPYELIPFVRPVEELIYEQSLSLTAALARDNDAGLVKS